MGVELHTRKCGLYSRGQSGDIDGRRASRIGLVAFEDCADGAIHALRVTHRHPRCPPPHRGGPVVLHRAGERATPPTTPPRASCPPPHLTRPGFPAHHVPTGWDPLPLRSTSPVTCCPARS